MTKDRVGRAILRLQGSLPGEGLRQLPGVERKSMSMQARNRSEAYLRKTLSVPHNADHASGFLCHTLPHDGMPRSSSGG